MIAADPSSIARAITARTCTADWSIVPSRDRLVADQPVLGVEMQHAHALDADMRHVGLQIVEQRLPAREDRLVRGLRAQQPQGRRRRRCAAPRRPSRRHRARGSNACRIGATATAPARRIRAAAPWRAAWCRGGGWRVRADIRSARNPAARRRRPRSISCAGGRGVRRRRAASRSSSPKLAGPFAARKRVAGGWSTARRLAYAGARFGSGAVRGAR